MTPSVSEQTPSDAINIKSPFLKKLTKLQDFVFVEDDPHIVKDVKVGTLTEFKKKCRIDDF